MIPILPFKLTQYKLFLGETLAEAAVRETVEETGVPCEFVSVICFRHMTGYRHGCDDIYFVCHLRPLSNNIVMDVNEISACKWIPVSEYVPTYKYVTGSDKICLIYMKILTTFSEFEV